MVKYVWVVFLIVAGTCQVFARDNDYVVASIGDNKVYFSQVLKETQGLNNVLKENFANDLAWRVDFITKYVANCAIALRAKEEGLEKDPQVRYALDRAERITLSANMLQRRLAAARISDQDLRNFYEQNKQSYTSSARIKVSYLKARDKKEADRIMAALSKGSDFAGLAGKRRVRIGSWIPQDQPFTAGIEGFDADGVRGLFVLEKGGGRVLTSSRAENYVFCVDEREPAILRSFDEVRGQVAAQYGQLMKQVVISEFIRETFDKEKVVIDKSLIERMFNDAAEQTSDPQPPVNGTQK